MDQDTRAQRLVDLVVQLLKARRSDAVAGLGSLLREIEIIAPGAIQNEAARIELRRLGVTTALRP